LTDEKSKASHPCTISSQLPAQRKHHNVTILTVTDGLDHGQFLGGCRLATGTSQVISDCITHAPEPSQQSVYQTAQINYLDTDSLTVQSDSINNLRHMNKQTYSGNQQQYGTDMRQLKTTD